MVVVAHTGTSSVSFCSYIHIIVLEILRMGTFLIFFFKPHFNKWPKPFNNNATSRNLYTKRYENAWVSVIVFGFSAIIPGWFRFAAK